MSPETPGTDAAVLRRLLEQAPDAILVVDGGGIVRYANPASHLMLGRADTARVGSRLGFQLAAGQPVTREMLPEPGPDGPVHFLAKPFAPAALAAKVREMLATPPAD